MIRLVKIGLLFFSGIIMLSGCLKRNDFPIIPAITFKSFVTQGDSAILTVSFTDGDGDIGYPQSDSIHRDFFIKYFEKRNGKYVERVLPVPFYYRMPVLVNEDDTKPLEGDITVYITPIYYDPFSQFDTIKYEIFIQDRALHESNHIEYEFVAPE